MLSVRDETGRDSCARISPDGLRVALDIREEGADTWIWNLARHVSTKITNDPASDGTPSWTPDGERIVFQSQRFGAANIFAVAADGTGPVERLTKARTRSIPVPSAAMGRCCPWRRLAAVVRGGAVFRAIRPERGMQDRIAGTWLVPR